MKQKMLVRNIKSILKTQNIRFVFIKEGLVDETLIIIESFVERVENTLGKGEYNGYQHFLLATQFRRKKHKISNLRAVKIMDSWKRCEKFFL